MNHNMDRRIRIIDTILQNRTLKISQLTIEVNRQLEEDKQVTSRTIKNDLQAIEDLYGVEISRDKGFIGYAIKGSSISDSNISLEEKEILEFVYQFMSPLKRTPIFRQFDETVTRIFAGSYLRKISSNHTNKGIQIGELSPDNGDVWLHTIYRAILEKKKIRFLYQTLGKAPKERIVSPYLLKEFRYKWYLAGYDHGSSKSEKVILFKLFRISQVELLEEPIFEDPEFNGEAFFKFSLGVVHTYSSAPIHVTLQFSGTICEIIKESPIHNTMTINGSGPDTLTVTICVYNTIELRNLILSYGSQCRVISPVSLQEDIRREVFAMNSMYAEVPQ